MTGDIDEAMEEDVAGAAPEEDRALTPVESAESDPAAQPEDEAPDDAGSEPEQLRAQVDQLENQLLRKRAEFDNFRKRTERERSEIRDLATAEVFKALLPTVDNLERAAVATGDESSVREGLSLIMKELRGLLDRHGLVAEDPSGREFDPERHQALSHEEVPGYSEGQIVDVFQKGYSIGERLIRPALVRVAKGGGEGAEADAAEEEQGSE